MRDTARYRIEDEPRRLPLIGSGTALLLLAPITIYTAIVYNMLMLLLPGVIGFFVGGPHRWRAPLLAVLSLAIFIALGIVNAQLLKLGVERIWFDYAQDIRIALTAVPMFLIVIELQYSLLLAEARRA